jgi:hypothetical protein
MKYLILILFSLSLMGAEKKIIYKYKKYEKFDLGNLEVKGKVIAPGDLSVRQRRRRRFKRDLYRRENFRDLIYKDLIFQR